MDYRSLHPGKFLKAVDLDGEATYTISSVQMESMQQTGESKPALEFEETDQKLILNRTNADSIAELYGPDTDDWIGEQITLFATKCKFGRDNVDCIRIREAKPVASNF